MSNMLLGVLFDYDNNDLGTLDPYTGKESTKGLVFLNGYLSATGYAFSSPDHFDVNDVLPSAVAAARADRRRHGLGSGLLQHRRQPAAPVLEPDL